MNAAKPATDIYERAFQFALRVVRLCKYLNQQRGVAKDARETSYWLRLAIESETVSKTRAAALHSEAEQLCRILGAIVVSTKRNTASQL